MKKFVLSAVALAAVFVAGLGVAAPAASSEEMPSGERLVGHGNVAVEPAYNADTGDLMYLLTPVHVPFPSTANTHAWSPLYIVEYPPGSSVGTLNCAGVPGNCPDHNGEVAGFAVANAPGVYGTDPTAVPGHDHVADPPGAPDWNVAWEVYEVLFTPAGVTHGITRLTTDDQIQAAVDAGYATVSDLGFAFNCSAVPASVYYNGTPVG